jgi:hypothetical protein
LIIVKNVPVLEAIQDVAPDAGYRVHGLKIAREPRRYSGRTAMRAPLSFMNQNNQLIRFSINILYGRLCWVIRQHLFSTICMVCRLELTTSLEQIPR